MTNELTTGPEELKTIFEKIFADHKKIQYLENLQSISKICNSFENSLEENNSFDCKLSYIEEVINVISTIKNQKTETLFKNVIWGTVYSLLKKPLKNSNFFKKVWGFDKEKETMDETLKKHEILYNFFSVRKEENLSSKIENNGKNIDSFLNKNKKFKDLTIFDIPNEKYSQSFEIGWEKEKILVQNVHNIALNVVTIEYILNYNFLNNANDLPNYICNLLDIEDSAVYSKINALTSVVKFNQNCVKYVKENSIETFTEKISELKKEYLDHSSSVELNETQISLQNNIFENTFFNSLDVLFKKNYLDQNSDLILKNFEKVLDEFKVNKEDKKNYVNQFEDKLIFDEFKVLYNTLIQSSKNEPRKIWKTNRKKIISNYSNIIKKIHDSTLKKTLEDEFNVGVEYCDNIRKSLPDHSINQQYNVTKNSRKSFKKSERSKQHSFKLKNEKCHHKKDNMPWLVKTGSAGNANKGYKP